jgi:hypothetical protein
MTEPKSNPVSKTPRLNAHFKKPNARTKTSPPQFSRVILWHWCAEITCGNGLVDQRSNRRWSSKHKYQYQFTIEQACKNFQKVFKNYFTNQDYLFRKEVAWLIGGLTYHIHAQLPSAEKLCDDFKSLGADSTTATDDTYTLEFAFHSKDYRSKRTGRVKSKGEKITMLIKLWQEVIDLKGAHLIL